MKAKHIVCNTVIKLVLLVYFISGVNCDGLIAKSCEKTSTECVEHQRPGQVLKSENQNSHSLSSIYGDLFVFIADSLNVFAPVSTTVENDLCRNHSLWFQDGVRNNEPWALRMLDASSKLPSGLLAGNVVHLGNYDQCLSVENVESKSGSFNGQHCMVAIGEKSFATELNLMDKCALFYKHIFSNYGKLKGDGDESRPFSMLWSVCVPSSCAPRDVEQHLRSAMRTRLGDVSITVQDGACSTRTSKPSLTTTQQCYIGVLSAFVILAVGSTAYDHMTSYLGSPRKELLLAFSVLMHWRRLVRVDAPTADVLPVVNGLKIVSMMWVYATHLFVAQLMMPAVNANILLEWADKAGTYAKFVFNPTLSVDSFFVISGLLMSFNYMNDREKGHEINLPNYYLRRYIRLTPLYAVNQMLTTMVLTVDSLRETPFVNHFLNRLSSNCKAWLPTMLYCFIHTWYLAVDMQLFWISPLILYPLWRWPSLGKKMVAAFTALGMAISVAVVYVNELRPKASIVDGDLGTKLFFPTYTRFTPWMIGIGVGYALHATKRVSPGLARSTVTFCWVISVTLMVASLVLLSHFIRHDYQYDRVTSSLYLGLMRPAWALGLAWFVFALSRGYGGVLTTLHSSHAFDVLSRLAYPFYLVHCAMLISLPGTKAPVYISYMSSISWFVVILTFSVVAAVVSHLIFEAPPIYIERCLRSKQKTN